MSSCWADSVKGFADGFRRADPGNRRISASVLYSAEDPRRSLEAGPVGPEKVRPAAGRSCFGSTAQSSNVPKCFGPAV